MLHFILRRKQFFTFIFARLFFIRSQLLVGWLGGGGGEGGGSCCVLRNFLIQLINLHMSTKVTQNHDIDVHYNITNNVSNSAKTYLFKIQTQQRLYVTYFV